MGAKVRFVCNDEELNVLVYVGRVVKGSIISTQQCIEIDHPSLIAIARILRMVELEPAISNEEAILRLGIGELVSPAPENGAGMPRCEICGQPVKSKRAKTCSDECTREKQRRYARDYYHRKGKTTEDAGGGGSSPLSQAAETFSSREWGSDPGDEPVRAGDLG